MASKKTILLAEDQADQREMLTMLLEGSGYKVTPAPDGRRTLQYLKKQKFDLVILDIMMPKFDGVEICNKLKHARSHMRVPVLILSALATGSTRNAEEWRRRTLADAFIAKPYNTCDLLKVIRGLLEHPVSDQAAGEKADTQAHLRDLGDLMTPADVARTARLRATKQEISTQYFRKP